MLGTQSGGELDGRGGMSPAFLTDSNSWIKLTFHPLQVFTLGKDEAVAVLNSYHRAAIAQLRP